MQTQVSCPQCGTPYTTELHQVVDSKRTPELKQMLLNGQLNVTQCPSCGFTGQLSTMLLFHDPDHEMFIVHMPTQLNMDKMQREQMIGQLAQQVMNALPPEERRAYMLQPKTIVNMQTFMENVLETEGITKEMIAHQRKQAELLQKLAQSDKDVQDYLIKERISEIDDQFFAMLQTYLDTASKMEDDTQLLPLLNLRAKLMTSTPAGKRIEERQVAMHGLNRDAKEAGGITPELLVKHLVANVDRQDIVDAIISGGQQAMSYEFFTLLTAEIEKLEKTDAARAKKLTTLREQLVQFQEAMRQQSEQVLGKAMETVQLLMQAPDKETAVKANMDKIDDAFMYVLSSQMETAMQENRAEDVKAFTELQELIVAQVESQLPPEVRLLQQLLRTETEELRTQLLDQNQQLLKPEILGLIDQVVAQSSGPDKDEVNGRLLVIKSMIEARISA
ncbi:MAG: hypothetical protein GY943_10420 [Chloroflexi bacterium]|nr:hypothetical protein [Chloroflexota bacterium]